jgi:uncharacterized protein (TIGR03083 family)
MAMDTQQYLDQLARNSDRLADAAAAAGVDAPVPTCDGWTVADLLEHMIRGDLWARTIIEQGKQGVTDRVLPEAPADQPEGDALVPYFRDGAKALVDVLSSTDSSTPVWTFGAHDRTAAFWQRRRAQETAVHRFDAESAAGTPTPIDAGLAVDGIDEFLVTFLPRLADNFGTVGEGTIHVHCTDADGEWLIVLRDGQPPAVTREHAKGDVAARGTASDLQLFVWGRVPADSLEVFGDAELLQRFGQAIRV